MTQRWTSLRFWAVVSAAALVLGSAGCELTDQYDGTSVLEVMITAQPQGGYGVDTVWCSFTARALDTAISYGNPLLDPITLTTVWHSPHGTYNRQDFEFSTCGVYETHTVFKCAPPGAHLDKDFWVEFYYEDALGSESFCSDTANCR